MIRYTVRADAVAEHLELLRAVYDELAVVRPDGLRWATYRLPDGVGFLDLVDVADPGVLAGLESFPRYRATLDQRCTEPPVTTGITEVGGYGNL